nr:hypothetical protein [Tanacetum cinerariifolium]
MIGNISYLSEFEEINRGYVAFGRNPKGSKITCKGKIKTGILDFDDVYFVKELKFNLFSVSQMCDKKNNVLFTDIECIVLSSNFKLPDDNHVLLRVPRKNNMYNADLKNIVPLGELTCLFAKVTLDESNLWHRRLGHINFKTMNKLVKGNLVRGLPAKVFENNHTCVTCKKGKQHRASCKSKPVSSVSQPIQRKNRTLIEAARTMLADSLLPIRYVQNRVLVNKPHDKTPYELLLDITPSIGFMMPFGCPVTIVNTLDPLGNLMGRPMRDFWLDTLACIQEHFDADKVGEGNVQQLLFPLWYTGSKDPRNTDVDATFEVKEPESEVYVSPRSSAKTTTHDDKTKREAKGKSHVELSTGARDLSEEFEDFSDNSIDGVNAAGTPVTTVRKNSTNSTNTFSVVVPSNTVVSLTLGKSSYVDPSTYLDDLNMPALEGITYSDYKDDVGAAADFSNLKTNITVSPIPTTRVHKDHPVTQIIGNLSLAPQTRSMTRMVKEQGALTQINNEDFHTCMFACFLSQGEPKKVWVLVDLPKGKRAIGSKWVFKNKKDKRGIVVRNKAQLVAQGHTQEEGIDYEKSLLHAFLYGTIKEEVYVCHALGFEDHGYLDKVYKVVKALYGLHQAPRAWYETLANYLLENGFQWGKIDQTLFIKKQKGDILMVQKQDGIFISQDKYLAEILRKFDLIDGKSASTPIDNEKPLLKILMMRMWMYIHT